MNNTIELLSTKRPLVEGEMNGKKRVFFLDTGASVSLIDKRIKDLSEGKRFRGTLIGADGSKIDTSYVCNDVAYIGGKPFTQFVIADIRKTVESIRHATGQTVDGIICWQQLRHNGASVNAGKGVLEFNDTEE